MNRFLIKTVISILLVFSNVLSAENEVLDCVIEPSKLVELSSQVRGVIETVYVERGDFVKKGQLVATLMSGVEKASVQLATDRAKMQVDIKSRKAERQFRNNTLKQITELYHKKLASQREYDDAKTLSVVADIELEKARELKHLAVLELRRTQEVLKLRSMHSVVNGVVVEVMKSPGEFVEEQPVMKIAQINPLHVEVYVPLELYQKVQVGASARVVLNEPLKGDFLAEIEVVDYVMDPASSTFGVRLRLDNPDHSIPTGVKCQLNFNEDKKQLVSEK